MVRSVRLTMVVCMALVFASCDMSPTWNVVGKWKVDGSGTMEFTRGGMVNLTEGKTVSSLPYRFTSPSRFEVDLGPLGKVGWDVTVDKDTMALKGADGKTLKLTKVQDQAQKPGAAQKAQTQPKQGQVQQPQPQQKVQPAQPQQAKPQQAQLHQTKETQKPQQQHPQQGQQQHKS